MKRIAVILLMCLAAGCQTFHQVEQDILTGAGQATGCIYAPRASVVAGQAHYQFATNIYIEQTIPVEPRVANNLDVTGMAGVKGNVASDNKYERTGAGSK